MKKILSLALLLSSLFLANVQGQIALIYNGNTYQNGDNFTVNIEATAHQINTVQLKNIGNSAVRDIVVTLTPIEENGISAWGICAGGNCVAALTSTSFNLAPGLVDEGFAIDIDIDNSVPNPHSTYNVNITFGLVSIDIVMNVVVGTVGIDQPVANLSATAFPNPAEGIVNISYELNQPATLAIVDMQGRLVRQLPVAGTGTATLNDLPAGIYAYGILGSNNMKKLVVK